MATTEALKRYNRSPKGKANRKKWWGTEKGKAARQRANFKRYGITLEDRAEMYRKQKGLCAMCGEPLLSDATRHAYVDHCHATKRVRGLVHPRCNIFLGMLETIPRVVEKALAYLEKGEKKNVN